jgi:hypothetical protein
MEEIVSSHVRFKSRDTLVTSHVNQVTWVWNYIHLIYLIENIKSTFWSRDLRQFFHVICNDLKKSWRSSDFVKTLPGYKFFLFIRLLGVTLNTEHHKYTKTQRFSFKLIFVKS